MAKKEELYEYQYTTPNKKVIKEYLPAVSKPSGEKKNKNKVSNGNFLMLVGACFLVSAVAGVPEAVAAAAFTGTVIKVAIGGVLGLNGWKEAKEGKEYLGRIKRYGRYMKALEDKKYASIEDLSEKVGKKVKTVVKDLEFMIEDKWFLEGHIDRSASQFMLTDKVYEEYQKAEQGRLLREQEEREKALMEDDPVQKELQKVLTEGNSYVKQIHKLNDSILGDYVSQKLDKIEEVLISIFDLVKRRPEKTGELRKLMQYYLPMTVKILTSYRDFENERIQSKQLEDSKREIEETVDKVSEAVIALREKLFGDDVLDISSDLDVLETMMAQEGLIDDDLKIKLKE